MPYLPVTGAHTEEDVSPNVCFSVPEPREPWWWRWNWSAGWRALKCTPVCFPPLPRLWPWGRTAMAPQQGAVAHNDSTEKGGVGRAGEGQQHLNTTLPPVPPTAWAVEEIHNFVVPSCGHWLTGVYIQSLAPSFTPAAGLWAVDSMPNSKCLPVVSEALVSHPREPFRIRMSNLLVLNLMVVPSFCFYWLTVAGFVSAVQNTRLVLRRGEANVVR